MNYNIFIISCLFFAYTNYTMEEPITQSNTWDDSKTISLLDTYMQANCIIKRENNKIILNFPDYNETSKQYSIDIKEVYKKINSFFETVYTAHILAKAGCFPLYSFEFSENATNEQKLNQLNSISDIDKFSLQMRRFSQFFTVNDKNENGRLEWYKLWIFIDKIDFNDNEKAQDFLNKFENIISTKENWKNQSLNEHIEQLRKKFSQTKSQ